MHTIPNPDAAGLDAERLDRIEEHFRSAYVEPGKIAGFQVAVGRRVAGFTTPYEGGPAVGQFQDAEEGLGHDSAASQDSHVR